MESIYQFNVIQLANVAFKGLLAVNVVHQPQQIELSEQTFSNSSTILDAIWQTVFEESCSKQADFQLDVKGSFTSKALASSEIDSDWERKIAGTLLSFKNLPESQFIRIINSETIVCAVEFM